MALIGKTKDLFDLLFTRTFSLDNLKAALETGEYNTDEVNLAALSYVEECRSDLEDYEGPEREKGELIQGYESSHVVEAISLLLDYGLEPNKRIIVSDFSQEECNIMSELRHLENGYVAADALALLLEHGGDPNIIIDGGSLVRLVNSDVLFDLYEMPNRFRYDALVHYWMVLVGYGARLENGQSTVDPRGDFDISKLKNHRNYYYGEIQSDRSDDHMELCIFDCDTNCV